MKGKKHAARKRRDSATSRTIVSQASENARCFSQRGENRAC
jgi:hypothetical protein